MKQNSESTSSFTAEYLIQEFGELLKNNPEAAPRLIENLMNIDYDISKKDEQLYKLLTSEQRKLLHDLYIKRKHDWQFELQFKKVLFVAAGVGGLTYGIAKFLENDTNN
jgi:hypothetical protein